MLGTYAAALLVIGASVPVGAAVLRLAGRREWSWTAPALGLAVITMLAWWAVRLPGEGVAAVVAIVGAAVAGGVWALPAVRPDREQATDGAAVAGLALLAVSIPFAVEGHFGILGTGFNVDMSQHLFAAEWISTQIAPAPDLVQQGYPVGPHSLAVAGESLGADLATSFSGVTIAVPAIGAAVALGAVGRLGRMRAIVAALLVALPYLVASYVAQGSFKELFEAVFLVGLVVWAMEVRRARRPLPVGFALPVAVLAGGALYSYSGPGLAWFVGMLGAWALLELIEDRERLLETLRSNAAGAALAIVLLLALAAPDAGRIADFGGNAGNVANVATEPTAPASPSLRAQGAASDAGAAAAGGDERLDLFNDRLGNLFGQIPPWEMLGIWPSGDFRVEPGDGSVPAIAFYAGAALGLAALLVGLRAALRRREWALLGAVIAAVAVWLGAWALSTPYTTAKALMMIAPLLSLLALRGVLDRSFAPPRPRDAGSALGAVLAIAFVLAAGGSSLLALANAPVGPERYTAGIAKLRERLAGEPVLVLGPPGQIADRHGAEYFGWELRGARPICVEPFPKQAGGFDRPAPPGIRFVVTVGGKQRPPFDGMREVSRRRRVTLWEAPGFRLSAPAPAIDPDRSTDCALGLH